MLNVPELLAILLAVVVLGINFWVLSVSLSFLWGDAPFVPSTTKDVENMIALAEIGPEDQVVDLGSGDGRLVFAANKAGAFLATGYEINRWLCWHCRAKTWFKQIKERIKFKHQSFRLASLHDVDVVFVYLLPAIMVDIEKKLRTELKPGARVIANTFSFEHWPVEATKGRISRYRV